MWESDLWPHLQLVDLGLDVRSGLCISIITWAKSISVHHLLTCNGHNNAWELFHEFKPQTERDKDFGFEVKGTWETYWLVEPNGGGDRLTSPGSIQIVTKRKPNHLKGIPENCDLWGTEIPRLPARGYW